VTPAEGLIGVTTQHLLPGLRTGAIDAHAHVFAARLPMVEGARYHPSDDAPAEVYRACLDRHGVAGAILVQPSFLGTDNRYLLDAVARFPDRFRAVAVVSPILSEAGLRDLARQGVVGVRLNLIGASPPSLGHAGWRRFLQCVCSAGLFVEVQAEGKQWTAVLPALLSSGARIVIDHLGRPAHHDPHRCAGLKAVLAASAMPSVWVKLSAPYRGRADPALVVRSLLDHAGPNRLVWGSDWPWTQHPEVTNYGRMRRWLEDWIVDKAVSRQICEENARILMSPADPP
jgi:predicted TIM-barrel fold metal-dependent hydrolase